MQPIPRLSLPDACPRPDLESPWQQLSQLSRQPPDLASVLTRPAARQRSAAGFCLDYSRQPLDDRILQALLALAEAAGLRAALQALYDGHAVNNTEHRAATHVRLRRPDADPAARQRWQWAEAVRCGDWTGCDGTRITDVVNIGIGGSHLGPALAVSALGAAASPLRCHFISTVDPVALDRLLSQLDARRTLWIVSSKSFATTETRVNAEAACAWMDRHADRDWRARQLAAVTANRSAAEAFGVAPDRIFTLDDTVGGRYSLWSAVDLPVALTLGQAAMQALHAGAHAMDHHALSAPFADNLPVLMALIGIWNRNFLQRPTLAVVAYDSQLALLPDYLQQLVMESNGKRVTRDGQTVRWATAPVIWGGTGTDGQHSFHQYLHQGTDIMPVDFLVPASSASAHTERHDHLIANALAQAHALAFGSASPLADQGGDPALVAHRYMPGNRPSNLLLYRRLDAATLGALIALYEHKTFCESVIWGINPFDQWGVELGKGISETIYRTLQGGTDTALPADLAASLQAALALRTPTGKG